MLLAQAGILPACVLHAGQKLALLTRESYFNKEVADEI
jgi:hypothetical protein